MMTTIFAKWQTWMIGVLSLVVALLFFFGLSTITAAAATTGTQPTTATVTAAATDTTSTTSTSPVNTDKPSTSSTGNSATDTSAQPTTTPVSTTSATTPAPATTTAAPQAATVAINGLGASEATIKDSTTGDPVSANDDLSAYSSYTVNYNWSIPDNEVVHAGDTAQVTLPSNVKIATATAIDVKDLSGNTIGTFTADKDSQTGTITFGSYFATNTINRQGTLTLNVTGTNTTNTPNTGWISNKIGWYTNNDTVDGHPASITWNIAFNPSGKPLSQVKLVDTLGPGQVFDATSLVANTGSYDANGVFQSTGTITPTVTTEGNVITMIFNNVTTAVNLTYTTTLNGPGVNNAYTNAFTYQATDISGGIGNPVTVEDSHTAKLTYGGDGTGSGNDGSVTLTKENADHSQKLAGAIFKLEDATGNVLQQNLTTTADGTLTVNGLSAGTYQFVETQAPTGYQLDATPIPFTIDGTHLSVAVTAVNQLTPVTPPTNPGTPTEPGTPITPGTPTEPGTPTNPETPTQPGQPTTPGTPAQPGKPTTPTPAQPTAPKTPTTPGRVTTTTPGTPVKQQPVPTRKAAKRTLPQTSEASVSWMTILGMVLAVIMGSTIVGAMRRDE